MTPSQQISTRAFELMNTLREPKNILRKSDEILHLLRTAFPAEPDAEIQTAYAYVQRFRERAYTLAWEWSKKSNGEKEKGMQLAKEVKEQLSAEFPGFQPEIYGEAFGEAVFLNH